MFSLYIKATLLICNYYSLIVSLFVRSISQIFVYFEMFNSGTPLLETLTLCGHSSQYVQYLFSLCNFCCIIVKFKLSNRKTVYVPRDNEIFNGISLTLATFRLSGEFSHILTGEYG